MLRLIVLSLLTLSLYAKENLSSLLTTYKKESDLSKITKQEAAGIIDVFTREDLEQMQAKDFNDVLQLIGGLHATRLSNNIAAFSKPTTNTIQLPSVRLYINDHDMSSSSFGSAFLIWGELPLEYIDHIEIYKGASSIEFGNETASLIIRLYTKRPKRETGSKVRIYTDNKGSLSGNIYHADTLENGLSYFAYGNVNNIKRTTYHNEYNQKNYDIKSNRQGYNLYFDLEAKSWSFEAGSYSKTNDNLLGMGIHRTPTGGELDSYHHYVHFIKKFAHKIKLELSYDNLAYDRTYEDENGIQVANLPLLDQYHIQFNDTISSIVLEKVFQYDKHTLLIGSFYKYKQFSADGDYTYSPTNYLYTNSYSNALNLYSAYGEYTYNYNDSLRVMFSAKGDFFRYSKAVKSSDESIFRVGAIKHINSFQLKAFLTKSYVPVPFYQLYNPDNTPYKANPNLNNMGLDLGSISLKYKKNAEELEIVYAKNRLHNIIVYDRNNPYGYTNTDKNVDYTRYQIKYTHHFNIENKIILDLYTGNNSNDVVLSPQYAGFLQLFNKIDKLDIYNELIYKSAYKYLGLSMDASFNYTLALKYHINKDLSVGLRGENLFNDAFEQAYRGYDKAIPVTDQKVWFNLEYLF